MILNAIAEKLKRQSKDDQRATFRGTADRAGGDLVLAVSAQLPDLKEMFRERGFEVDHSTSIGGF